MRRLLVVEDHADVLEMMTLLLESGGYEVVAAATVAEASRALEKSSFDLVLADLVLDVRNIDACWRTIDSFVDLARPAPVGLVTAWTVKPEEPRKHGLAFMLRKPCTRDHLFEQLATTLFLPDLAPPQQQALRAYFDDLSRGAYSELATLCTDDVVYRLPGTDPRYAKEIRGRDAFVGFTSRTFQAFRDPGFELSSIRPLPNGAMVEYVSSWRDDADTHRMPGAVMFEFNGPLISRINVRVDTDELR